MALIVVVILLASSCSSNDEPDVVVTQTNSSSTSTGVQAAATSTIEQRDQTTVASTRPAADDEPTDSSESQEVEIEDEAQSEPISTTELTIEVIETYPHDPDAFTQGLELIDSDTLLESTGLVGSSDLRLVDLETGDVEKIVPTPSDFFAEGATKVDDEIIQLTWKAGTAFYWNAETFELNRQVSYEGQGWGLCFDGQQLIMTDGSAELTFRDPATFEETGRIRVTSNAQPVDALNEIECVDGTVWANRWTSDEIVGIDPTTGAVTATVDAVVIRHESTDSNAVLNGIAWDETTDTFLLTGKLWPTIYRVKFVPIANG